MVVGDVGPRDYRPRVRMGGRFAGKVSSVEFGDGGVHVVEVERDQRCDPLVGADLDDLLELDIERLGAGGRTPSTTEGEARPAGSDCGRGEFSDPEISGRLNASDFRIP